MHNIYCISRRNGSINFNFYVMNREIKFRFWDIDKKQMVSHEKINKDHAYRYIYRDDYRSFILPMHTQD